MRELKLNSPTIDSREVAEMVEKNHADLLRDIRKYEEYLGKSNFALAEYFTESIYKDLQQKERICFLVTKKGCELIAHKLTGEKGVIFSARYIDKFHAMETELKNQYKIPRTYSEALRLAAEQCELIETQNQIIGELKPKADYVDRILNNPGLMTITQIAKDYGFTGPAMNATLHDLNVQFKQSEQWLLYKNYSGLGYTHSDTVQITRSNGMPDIKLNTKWTQKGRLFLYELLKMHNILPDIERLYPIAK